MTDLNLFTVETDVAKMAKVFRRLKELDSSQFESSISISVLANFSTQYLVQSLHSCHLNAKTSPRIHDAGFDQWEFELRNPTSRTNQDNFDFLLLLLSSTRLILNPSARDVRSFVQHLKTLLEDFSKRSSTKIILSLPEPLSEGTESSSYFYEWVQEMRSEMLLQLAELATLVDLDPLILEFGKSRWFSTKFLITAKFSCHPNCYPLFGNYLAKVILGMVKWPVKLVIIDLDNTLWDGVVGDLGWEGVGLDPDGNGYPHLMLQQFLLGLKRRGILLALCSKNDFENAKAVFDRRPEMILRLDDFIKAKINWLPKSQNISQILTELNLTSSGIVFLDDSKFEREEVKAAHPEIFVPDLPESVEDWCLTLSQTGKFSLPKRAKEEMDKSTQYQIEEARKAEASKFGDFSDFLASLELILEPIKIGPQNLDRVHELIHKTNQFNLKTKRLSLKELEALTKDAKNFCCCYQLKDRFSDYGIISVFIAEHIPGGWGINTWLMSCRSMGRQVEDAVFKDFFNQCQSGDIILGEYIRSPKNGPVADLLERMGFKGSGDHKEFIKGTHQPPEAKFVQILRKSEV